VWLGINQNRLFIRKTSELGSKVHIDALVTRSSSVRATSNFVLGAHTLIFEDLIDNSTSPHGDPNESIGSQDSELHIMSETGVVTVEVGFETGDDMNGWMETVQSQISSLSS